MRDPRPINDRGQVSRGELQALARDADRRRRTTSTVGVEIINNPTGVSLHDAREPGFLARITGRTPPPPDWDGPVMYSWEPVQRLPDNSVVAIPGLGVSEIDPPETASLYAVERNGLFAEQGDIVVMRRAGPNYFDFDVPGVGGDGGGLPPPLAPSSSLTVVTDVNVFCPPGTADKTRRTYRAYVPIGIYNYPVVFEEI